MIVAGREDPKFDAVTAASPGMTAFRLDVSDAADIVRMVADLPVRSPALNLLVNNSGAIREEDVSSPSPVEMVIPAEVATNLLGSIRMVAALLLHVLSRPRARIINIASSLAVVPFASLLIYCATKAVTLSYTVSLREHLRGSPIRVTEVAPPLTEIGRMPGKSSNPDAMPLDKFIDELLPLLEGGGDEAIVAATRPFRDPEREGRYYEMVWSLAQAKA